MQKKIPQAKNAISNFSAGPCDAQDSRSLCWPGMPIPCTPLRTVQSIAHLWEQYSARHCTPLRTVQSIAHMWEQYSAEHCTPLRTVKSMAQCTVECKALHTCENSAIHSMMQCKEAGSSSCNNRDCNIISRCLYNRFCCCLQRNWLKMLWCYFTWLTSIPGGEHLRKSRQGTRKSYQGSWSQPIFSFAGWQPPLCAHFCTLPIQVSPNRALMRMHARKDYTCFTPTPPAAAKEPCEGYLSLLTDLDFHSAHPSFSEQPKGFHCMWFSIT